MKLFLSILALVLICLAVLKIYEYAEGLNRNEPAPTTTATDAWPPLDPKIRDALAQAKNKGPAQFKALIDKFAARRSLKDPWLANYQIDYVVMISINDPLQATRIISDIRSRITTNSPVYPRLAELKGLPSP